jgi:DNA replication protein DnaC
MQSRNKINSRPGELTAEQNETFKSQKTFNETDWENVNQLLKSHNRGIPEKFKSVEKWTPDAELKIPEETKLITITGPAGSGKTEIAVSILKAAPPVKHSPERLLQIKSRLRERISECKTGNTEEAKQELRILEAHYKSRLWQYRPAQTLFITADKLLVHKGTAHINSILSCDALLIDNLMAEHLKQEQIPILRLIIEFYTIQNKRIIITTPSALEQYKNQSPGIYSVIISGQIIKTPITKE